MLQTDNRISKTQLLSINEPPYNSIHIASKNQLLSYYHMFNPAVTIASFPGLPRFCSSVCVQYNTRKRKSSRSSTSVYILNANCALPLPCIILNANCALPLPCIMQNCALPLPCIILNANCALPLPCIILNANCALPLPCIILNANCALPLPCIILNANRRTKNGGSLASFPGLPRLRFLIASSMQKLSQKAW